MTGETILDYLVSPQSNHECLPRKRQRDWIHTEEEEATWGRDWSDAATSEGLLAAP